MCRAFLSPYWDTEGNERYTGRFNLGAITLALPRYAIMSEGDRDKFFDILDKHYDYAIEVHTLTYEKMRKVKAKTNPLMFCEGGCLVKLNPDDTIGPALESATYSIGFIGLEEVSYHMTGKHLHEDNSFAIEVLEHLNYRIEKSKKETGKLIALYSTPSESLCDKMQRADRYKFGAIPFVTDKEYYHNSFHVGSNFILNATDKQDVEYPLFHLANGGHIMYNEFPTVDNFEGIKLLVDRAMAMGFYYGVNLEIGTCHDCGFQGQISCTCPVCDSTNVTGITRVCGYLGYSSKQGDTRYNQGKHAEVINRVKHFGVIQ